MGVYSSVQGNKMKTMISDCLSVSPGPLSSKELQNQAKILMERIDGKGGNHNGRIDFEEFLPWYQVVCVCVCVCACGRVFPLNSL